MQKEHISTDLEVYGMKRILVMVLVTMMLITACAETYRFEGAAPAFTAQHYTSGATLSVTAEKLVLLGYTDDGCVLAYADNTLFVIVEDELTRISSRFTNVSLPNLSEIADIGSGSSSSSIESLQRALTLLGYFNSSVDGSFGSRTRNAITTFQADRGLEETGVADAITQRLIYSLAGPEIAIVVGVEAVDQFGAIQGRTENSIEPLEGRGLSFEYDDISGTGFIGNGSAVTISSGSETADIDSYTFTLRFGFAVAEGKEAVTVTPVIQITNTSVRRPILQNAMLKSGDSRVTIKATGVASSVSGSKSVETATIKLTEEADALLAACAENGELKLRLNGKYDSYDVTVPAGQLERIAEIGELAVAMSPEEN